MSAGTIIKIAILGETKGLTEAVKIATEDMDHLQKHAKSTGDKIKGFVKGAAVGVAGVVAVAAGIAIKAGDELNESQDMLKNALENTGQSAEGLKKKLSPLMSEMEHFGYTNTEVNDGLAKLVRVGDKLTTATTDMSLAANIAKGRHIALAAAEDILVKVRTGHVALLGRMGIAVKDANGKLISQQEAIAKLSGLYKGSAEESTKSLTGKTAELKAKFQDIAADVGQALIPIMTSLASFIVDKVIPAFSAVVDWVKTNWPKMIAAIKPTLDTIAGYVKGFIAIVQGLWQRFGGTILTFVKDAWGSIKTAINGALEAIKGIFRLFADLITGKWGKLWGDVLSIFSGLWKIVRGAIGLAFTELKAWVGIIWDAISGVIKGAFNGVVDFFKKAPGRLAGIFSGMWDGIGSAFKGVLNYVIGLWNGIHFTLPTISLPKVHIPGLGDVGGGSFGGQTFRVPQLPYFHGGGIFNSGEGQGLAVLKDGEGVFTQAQMQALGAGAATNNAGGTTILNFPAGSSPAAVYAAQQRWNKRNGRSSPTGRNNALAAMGAS